MFDFSDPSTMLQSSGGSAVSSAGDPVGFVTDLSSHGNNCVQSSGTVKPTYRVLSGVPCIEFDGGDGLDLSSFVDFYAAGAMSGAVSLTGASQTGTSFFSMGYTGSNLPVYQMLRSYTSGSATTFLRNNANSTRVNVGAVSVGAICNGSWNVLGAYDTGTEHAARKNGGTWDTQAYTRSGAVSLDTASIGSLLRAARDSFFTGHMSRIAICSGALSETDMDAIEAWVAAPAGIALA